MLTFCSLSLSLQQEDSTTIDLKETVTLTFALRYLNFFARQHRLAHRPSSWRRASAGGQYKIGEFGALAFYLAPDRRGGHKQTYKREGPSSIHARGRVCVGVFVQRAEYVS